MEDYPFDTEEKELIKVYNPVFYDQMNVSKDGVKKDISAFHVKSGIYNCYACSLSHYHKSVTMSNFDASLMIIGQTPQDIYFEQEPGKMLANLLKQLQFDFNDIYFTSAVKCEGSSEFAKCHHHLVSEIILVQPLVIIALGYHAGACFMEHIQIKPGDVTTLPTRSDVIITYRVQDVMNDQIAYNFLLKHLSMAKAQLEYRKQEKGKKAT
jgi:uracil-DNA glycosylase family 4